jgi:hypothetical protein
MMMKCCVVVPFALFSGVILSQPVLFEDFDNTTKALLQAEGWDFFPNAGFTLSDQQGYDEFHMRSNAGIGQDELMGAPCMTFDQPYDTIEFLYRSFGSTVGFFTVGYQDGYDPIGVNVVWLDSLPVIFQWTLISIPYEPPPLPYQCRIVFGFGTIDAGGKLGIENFTSLHATAFYDCDLLLPMEITSFTGTLINPTVSSGNRSISLSWEAHFQGGVDRFDIMRSNDGITFNKVGEVMAHQGAGETTYYAFVDEHILYGNNYYQLNLMSMDSSILTSPIEVIDASENDELIIEDGMLQSLLYGATQFTIYNLSGALLKTVTLGHTESTDISAFSGLCVIHVLGSRNSRHLVFLNPSTSALIAVED